MGGKTSARLLAICDRDACRGELDRGVDLSFDQIPRPNSALHHTKSRTTSESANSVGRLCASAGLAKLSARREFIRMHKPRQVRLFLPCSPVRRWRVGTPSLFATLPVSVSASEGSPTGYYPAGSDRRRTWREHAADSTIAIPFDRPANRALA